MMGRDRQVSSAFTSPSAGNDVLCLPTTAGFWRVLSMHIPGAGHRVLSQDTHAMHRSPLTHGCDSVPSFQLLPSRLGEGAFSRKLSLPRLGREPSLVHFLPGKGGIPWTTAGSALPGRAAVRHSPLQGDNPLASLGKERATWPVLGPPWSRASTADDSQPLLSVYN
jgi:hypothetical protein